ncbi:MAG: phosphotransferase, partial [Actinomycetota bacterium]|nr:phosphotransferase [Actinomycetota bacterium]
CHGDFHPFNVLADGTECVVLDWTGALLADPCFDVAFTELVVGNPPLVLPDPLAVVGRLAGRVLARRFVRAYRAADPTASLEHLDWYRALHRIRVLLERASLRLRHGDERMGHPFELLAPVAARDLTSATGVQVSA